MLWFLVMLTSSFWMCHSSFFSQEVPLSSPPTHFFSPCERRIWGQHSRVSCFLKYSRNIYIIAVTNQSGWCQQKCICSSFEQLSVRWWSQSQILAFPSFHRRRDLTKKGKFCFKFDHTLSLFFFLFVVSVIWKCNIVPAFWQLERSEEALGASRRPKPGEVRSCFSNQTLQHPSQAPGPEQTSHHQRGTPSGEEPGATDRPNRPSVSRQSSAAVHRWRSKAGRAGQRGADGQENTREIRGASSNQSDRILRESQRAAEQPEDEVWEGRKLKGKCPNAI